MTCNLKFGEHCVLDKKTKVKFGTVIHRSEGVLECVHIDVCGSTKTAMHGGHQYFVSFVDDLFRSYWVYTMRQKFEVLNILVKWKNLMEKQVGRKINVLYLIRLRSAKIDSDSLSRKMIMIFTSQLENIGWLKR